MRVRTEHHYGWPDDERRLGRLERAHDETGEGGNGVAGNLLHRRSVLQDGCNRRPEPVSVQAGQHMDASKRKRGSHGGYRAHGIDGSHRGYRTYGIDRSRWGYRAYGIDGSRGGYGAHGIDGSRGGYRAHGIDGSHRGDRGYGIDRSRGNAGGAGVRRLNRHLR